MYGRDQEKWGKGKTKQRVITLDVIPLETVENPTKLSHFREILSSIGLVLLMASSHSSPALVLWDRFVRCQPRTVTLRMLVGISGSKSCYRSTNPRMRGQGQREECPTILFTRLSNHLGAMTVVGTFL